MCIRDRRWLPFRQHPLPEQFRTWRQEERIREKHTSDHVSGCFSPGPLFYDHHGTDHVRTSSASAHWGPCHLHGNYSQEAGTPNSERTNYVRQGIVFLREHDPNSSHHFYCHCLECR